MSSDDAEAMDLIRQIRRDRATMQHEYLCTACAHRYHESCDGLCDYCGNMCQCVCQRWNIPVEPVESE